MKRAWLRFQSALRNLWRKPRIESQLDDELHAYVDMATDEKIAAGLSAPEARRAALAEFGGIEQVKQAVRDRRVGTGIELLWQDARYGVRQLRRNRGFTLTAVALIASTIPATQAARTDLVSVLHS